MTRAGRGPAARAGPPVAGRGRGVAGCGRLWLSAAGCGRVAECGRVTRVLVFCTAESGRRTGASSRWPRLSSRPSMDIDVLI